MGEQVSVDTKFGGRVFGVCRVGYWMRCRCRLSEEGG